MKQARFEQQYRPLWDSLEQQLDQLEALRVSRKKRLPLDSFSVSTRKSKNKSKWKCDACQRPTCTSAVDLPG